MPRSVLALHVSEWKRIKEHVKEDDNRERSKFKAYIESLNKASHDLTKTWTDSYEKILERQELELAERQRLEEQSRMQFYRQLMENKQAERLRVLADARDTVFKQKDEPRMLESALMCSEMLREQEAQREFNKKVKLAEKSQDKEYAKNMEENFDKWQKSQSEKQQVRLRKNHQEFLLVKAQAEEARARRVKEAEEEKALGKKDLESSTKEMETLKQITLEMKAKEQARIKHQLSEAIDLVNKKKADQVKMERMEEKLIEIYDNARRTIDELKKKKERQLAAEKNKFREHAKSKLSTGNDKELLKMKEEEAYKKATEEIRLKEIELTKKAHAQKEAMKKEKRRLYEEWLKEEEKRNTDEANTLAWEIANRLQNIENTKAFEERKKEKMRKKNEEHKLFILKQKRELKEEEEKRKAEMSKFYQADRSVEMKAADEKFLAYADEMLKECEAAGRPTHPLHKVINNYKRRYMLPEKHIPNQLRSHFPSITTEHESSSSNTGSSHARSSKKSST